MVPRWWLILFFLLGVFPSLDTIMYLYAYIYIYVYMLQYCMLLFAIAIPSYSHTGWWFGTCFIFHILGIIIPTDFHIFQRGWNHQPVSVSVSLSKDWKEVDHQPFAVFPRPGGSVLRSLQIDLEPQITGLVVHPTDRKWVSSPQWFTWDK